MLRLPLSGSQSQMPPWRRAAAIAVLALVAAAFPALCDAGPRGGGGGPTSGTYIKPSQPAPETGQSPAEASTPPVSLEDARKITSSEEAQSLALPPRTIADITAVLDREKPDPAKVAAARAVADKAPPAGLDGAAAARFYFDRGTSAGELGRSAQELADYRKAAELIEPLKSSHANDYVQFINNLGLTEGRAGNIREEIRLDEKLVGFAENTPGITGALVGQYYLLVTANIRLGNMAAAGDWLAKCESLVTTTPWRGRALARLNLFRSRYDWAKATYAEAQGKYTEAEGYYRRALAENITATAESKSWDVVPPAGQFETASDIILRDLAGNLVAQGRLIDAEIEARRGLMDQLRMRGRYGNETAIMLVSLGNVIAAQGRNAEAEKLDKVAIDTYVALGHGADSYPLNLARRNLASTLVAQRRWAEALQQFDLVRQGVGKDPDMLRVFVGGNLDFSVAALHGNRVQAALEVSQHALERRIKGLGEKHYDTAEARGFHAMALAASGNQAAALSDYAAAVPILLQASRQTSDEEAEGSDKEFRLQQILEGYLSLLADQRSAGPDAVAEAFLVADAARGRSVQKALAASAARAAVGDPQLADLVRRDQDALRQIGGLNSLISSILLMASSQQDAATVQTLRAQIDQLRGARATIRAEIEKRFPDYVNLIDPMPATVADAQKALEPGEALIATYVAEERSYVWAVPKAGPVAFAPVALKRGEVEAIVANLRKALEPEGSSLGDIPPFDVTLAYKLYSLFLKPVEAGWKGAKRLLVVSHGALGQLPLALLVTQPASLEHDKPGEVMFSGYKKVPWLVREVALAELPSVASLLTLRGTRAPGAARKPFVGFGDPWFSAKEAAEAKTHAGGTEVAELETRGVKKGLAIRLRSIPKTESVNKAELGLLPRLPETAEEVREVALALHANPQTDVFLGARASEETVRKMKLDDRRVVMFATHGLVPGDLDGLSEPALALSAPSVAGGEGDGLLTMSKILGLKLNADWVVLSACNTAAGNGAGAEAVSGLGLAFFYAGTRALMVTNWPVETTSARALTTAVFRLEAASEGMARADALRGAMLELMDGPGYMDKAQNRVLFSYAHPLFWAPFTLVGDGGSTRTR
ncbi:MAG: CHAT domain-containing protein [Alphaproteobacteria bacterium]